MHPHRSSQYFAQARPAARDALRGPDDDADGDSHVFAAVGKVRDASTKQLKIVVSVSGWNNTNRAYLILETWLDCRCCFELVVSVVSQHVAGEFERKKSSVFWFVREVCARWLAGKWKEKVGCWDNNFYLQNVLVSFTDFHVLVNVS